MVNELKDYICSLDEQYKTIIGHAVDEKGIEKYLSHQLIYLDCSRIYNDGSRAMQTIGFPYKKEISAYLYALENHVNFLTVEDSDVSKFNKKEWLDKLIELHKANLEYEKANPPVWYGDKKPKNNVNKEHSKLPRRRKYAEQTIPGMGKELNNTERLKRLSAQFGNLTFNIKRK